MPTEVAASMTSDAVVWAENPWIGSSFTMFLPNVLMILQPPVETPAAIVTAQSTLTQVAMSNCGVRRKLSHDGKSLNALVLDVARNNVSAIIPMDFCASLRPCSKAIHDELSSCSERNPRFAWRIRIFELRFR